MEKNKPRILLVKPPFYRLMGSHFNGMDLGLGYIAAVLNANGFEAKIYNADYADSEGFITLEDIFNNYENYKKLLNDKGAPIWQEAKTKIAGFNPDIIGLSMFTGAYKSAKIVAGLAKEANPSVKILVGGPQATLAPEKTLENEEFDYLVRGEGEFAFLELAQGQPIGTIKNLSFKKDKKVINNEPRDFIKDLNSLPFPARDSFLESGKNIDMANVITGRGCPYACRFCASPKLWQRKVRFRSPDNVVKELKEIMEKHGQKSFSFVDDTFTLNRERTKEICEKIILKKLNIEWRCDSRADRLDEELVMLMKKAGCVCIRMGVESGSEKILKLMQKNVNKNDIRKAANLVKKHGISLTVYFIAGFPGETNEDLKETIEFAKELEADYYSLGIFSPYYGTEIYYMLKEQGKIKEEDWEYFFHQSMEGWENKVLDPGLLKEFLSINKLYAKGRRI